MPLNSPESDAVSPPEAANASAHSNWMLDMRSLAPLAGNESPSVGELSSSYDFRETKDILATN